jgi:hypothetical protein
MLYVQTRIHQVAFLYNQETAVSQAGNFCRNSRLSRPGKRIDGYYNFNVSKRTFARDLEDIATLYGQVLLWHHSAQCR